MNIYEENGYANRTEYLKSLADDYGVPEEVVFNLSFAFGKSEDFDGLVCAVEDWAYWHGSAEEEEEG